MKFTVSSQTLQQLLMTTGKVISNKNTFPILDYFLMELSDGVLKVTTSDLETTMISSIKIENVEMDGVVAAPAKLMLDTLKEFAVMPLTIEVNCETWEITISWKSGSLSIPGADPVSYPVIQSIAEERCEIEVATESLTNGINKTIFATADDELRPVMNGIYFHIEPSTLSFVATDAHKLVKCQMSHSSDLNSSFILPKKPANLLKGVLAKSDSDIKIVFDSKNAMFTFKNYTLVCRLIEGNYPNYNAVIPTNNPNKMLVDRVELLNAIRRVAVCSNPTTNLIRLDVANNEISLQTQDLDFSVSANETLSCSYDAQPITIGFKSTFLVEILSNIESEMVAVELADSTRAGVFKPVVDDASAGEVLMLLMPMMINA
ncbi:MAG: DNA polymerase III subunit beta [Rikenellaceae bacterium]